MDLCLHSATRLFNVTVILHIEKCTYICKFKCIFISWTLKNELLIWISGPKNPLGYFYISESTI